MRKLGQSSVALRPLNLYCGQAYMTRRRNKVCPRAADQTLAKEVTSHRGGAYRHEVTLDFLSLLFLALGLVSQIVSARHAPEDGLLMVCQLLS